MATITSFVESSGSGPNVASGLCLWLDANASSNFVFSTGSNISQWNDKSGCNNHAVQPTATARPTYATGSNVNFSATGTGSNYLNLTDNTVFNYTTLSMFVVEQRGTSSEHCLIIGGTASGTNTNFSFGYEQGNVIFSFSGVTTALSNGNTFPAYVAGSEPYRMWSANYNGTTRSMYMNGSFSNSNAFTTNLTSWVGASIGHQLTTSNYIGNIHEVLFYKPALTLTSQQQVESYLAWKWNLQGSLPAGHPYKNAPYGGGGGGVNYGSIMSEVAPGTNFNGLPIDFPIRIKNTPF